MRISNKFFAVLFFLFCAVLQTYAQSIVNTKYQSVSDAIKKMNPKESISFIDAALVKTRLADEREALYACRGFIQEQLGNYADALKSYTLSLEQNPLQKNNAVQLAACFCALSYGDFQSALSLVTEVLLTATDQNILAKARLYSVWVDLCSPQSETRFTQNTTVLQAFLPNPQMKNVRVSVLFTLWWLTDDSKFATLLQNEYPHAPETAIAFGKSQIMPAPFIHFIPRIAVFRAEPAP